MLFRLALYFFISIVPIFAHGIFYEKIDNAIGIRVTAPNNIPIANAEINVYRPEASLRFTKGQTDVNGNFAFVPDLEGIWKVEINADSDHGVHKKELTITIDENLVVKDFQKTPFKRYSLFFGVFGLLIGIFGIIALIKSRKKLQN